LFAVVFLLLPQRRPILFLAPQGRNNGANTNLPIATRKINWLAWSLRFVELTLWHDLVSAASKNSGDRSFRRP
jgi:hypothetical protein